MDLMYSRAQECFNTLFIFIRLAIKIKPINIINAVGYDSALSFFRPLCTTCTPTVGCEVDSAGTASLHNVPAAISKAVCKGNMQYATLNLASFGFPPTRAARISRILHTMVHMSCELHWILWCVKNRILDQVLQNIKPQLYRSLESHPNLRGTGAGVVELMEKMSEMG